MIGVGDVVVCVDDGPCQCLRCQRGFTSPVVSVKLNALYRVEGFSALNNGDLSLLLVGIPARAGHRRGTAMRRFRKVLPADPKFIEQIRSLTPHRERELVPSQTSGDS